MKKGWKIRRWHREVSIIPERLGNSIPATRPIILNGLLNGLLNYKYITRKLSKNILMVSSDEAKLLALRGLLLVVLGITIIFLVALWALGVK